MSLFERDGILVLSFASLTEYSVTWIFLQLFSTAWRLAMTWFGHEGLLDILFDDIFFSELMRVVSLLNRVPSSFDKDQLPNIHLQCWKEHLIKDYLNGI